MKREVSIIGGGLVGCLWAVLLRRRGYPVRVFEKRPDMRRQALDEGRSINLVITSRGLHALEQAGLITQALKLSVPVYGRMIHARSGETAFQPYGRDNECNHSISRSGLNRFLLDAAEKAGARLFFESALEEVDFTNRRLVFSSGSVESYDLLFGTDGAGSKVRRKLAGAMPSKFKQSTDWLEADYKEMLLPAGSQLKKDALHIWPRGSHMMMALGNLDGSFTVTLYLPKAGSKFSFERMRSAEEIEELFRSEFSSAVPLIPNFVEQFLSHPQGELGTVRTSSWIHDDSVALMGDAAHAIVPFFGQGMNAGFEDCMVLSKALDDSGGDWASALSRYEGIQRPNADAIADMAIENWAEMRDKVGDPRFLLRKKVESLLEQRFPQLYKSRYGMITYTLIPYSLARDAGRIQDSILARLCEGLSQAEQFPIELGERLLRTEFVPFLNEHKIDLSRYQPPV